MSEWWTYRPEDLLLFSERVYRRLFELENAALWPWPLAAVALGALACVLMVRPRPMTDRMVAEIFALAWLVAGCSFMWLRYRTVNWAAAYVAPAFVVEALLLAWLGAGRGWLKSRRGMHAAPGLALMAYAIFLHPLVAPLAGRPLAAAEIFGVAPDPTAIATLGLLAAAGAGRAKWLLFPIPALWCLASWLTLQTMGAWEAWIPLAALLLALAATAAGRAAGRSGP